MSKIMERLLIAIGVIVIIAWVLPDNAPVIAEQVSVVEEYTPPKIEAESVLTITHSSWGSSGLGADWHVTIKNTSDVICKDPNIKLTYWGASGTKLYTSIMGHTEYEAISPGASITVDFPDIMSHPQAKTARAFIDGGVCG